MHTTNEAGFQIANFGHAMKEGLVLVSVVPRDVVGHPLYGDMLTDLCGAAHVEHEAVGHSKRAEVLHWPHRGHSDVARDPNGQLSRKIRQR